MKRKFLLFLRSFGIMVFFIGIFILLVFLTILMNNPLPIFIFFGCMFLLSFLMIPIILKRIHKEMQRQEDMTEEEIQTEINENGNRIKYDAYQIKAVVDNWKLASISDRIKGILFAVVFVACCISFVVLISLGYIVYGLVCFGVGAGLILISLIVVKILERRSLNMKTGKNFTKTTATVLSTTLSSQTTTGSKRKTYIRNTTYKVKLRRSSNETITAYSKVPYDVGDKVEIYVNRKNSKVVHITKKLENLFDEDEF